MEERHSDPGRPEALGDRLVPPQVEQGTEPHGAAPDGQPQREQAPVREPRRNDRSRDGALSDGVALDFSAGRAAQASGFGATASAPSPWVGYASLPLGPGNEAMEGGLSPAPRGYTGGAMGKFVAGLSPSFTDAAMGIPAPAGTNLYTPAEAVTTFSSASDSDVPRATHAPEH
jgi:hypothetical protein